MANPELKKATRINEELYRTAKTFQPGACFSKAPETFRARKAIFSWSVFEDREVYTPEALKLLVRNGTSVYIKNMLIKQLCNHEV